MKRIRVHFHKSCISAVSGIDALVTSSNLNLSGNLNGSYWRFSGRPNVNGVVHDLGGPQLAQEIAKIVPDVATRCPVGHAVVTPATGNLNSRFVVHCVAPDGLYGQQADPYLLQKTYASSWKAALDVGARGVVAPAIGCGIQGWRPADSMKAAMASLQVFASQDLDNCQERSILDDFHFALPDNQVWRTWCKLAPRWLDELNATPGSHTALYLLKPSDDEADNAACSETCI